MLNILTSRPRRGWPLATRAAGGAAGGLFDAGLAALSTFVMGTAVVRLVATADLALYSSMFAGFVVCALLPTQLVYLPAQVEANTQSGADGSRVVPDVVRDFTTHLPLLGATAVIACLLGVPLAAQAGWEVYACASVGMLVFATFSPLQSHARSVLHVVGRHQGAAVVSACTLLAQVLLVVVISQLSLVPVARPVLLGAVLLSTGFANAIGVVVALRLLRGFPFMKQVTTALRVRIGFLTAESAGQIGAYLAVLIVAGVLGTRAVAVLEAARVVASPVQILVVGLMSFLLPSAVRALATGSRAAFVRSSRRIVFVVLLAGAGYVVLLALAGDLIARLLGRRVDVALTGARAVVTAVDSTGAPATVALYTRRRVLALNAVAIGATAITLAVVPWALLLLGPFGLPLAQAISASIRLSALALLTKRLF